MRVSISAAPLSKEEAKQCTGKILLIEDNTELAGFISINLPEYLFMNAASGADGLRKALDATPSLIIIDATMPEMSGYECCKKIKETNSIRHIPVILLEAQGGSTKGEGMVITADKSLTKPFRIIDLSDSITHLLTRQTPVQEERRTKLNTVSPNTKPDLSALPDDNLLKRIYKILEKRYDDSSFNVEELSRHLSMSRASLHRKTVALSGIAPITIIQNYRLQKAADYLKGGYKSSQAAYMSGFDSPAYFTKCFREHYGVTPLRFF